MKHFLSFAAALILTVAAAFAAVEAFAAPATSNNPCAEQAMGTSCTFLEMEPLVIESVAPAVEHIVMEPMVFTAPARPFEIIVMEPMAFTVPAPAVASTLGVAGR